MRATNLLRATLTFVGIVAMLAVCARPAAAELSHASTESGIVLVRITTNANVYRIGEPIWLRVALINKSSRELAIPGQLAPFQITNLVIVDAGGRRLPLGPKPNGDSMIGNSGTEFRIPLPPGQPVYVGEWADVKHWGYHISQPGEYTLVATLSNFDDVAGSSVTQFKTSPADTSNEVRITVLRGRASNFAAPTSSPIPTIQVRTGSYSAPTRQRPCAKPNVEATVTNAVRPFYPYSAREMNVGQVTVEVEIVVGPNGNLSGASIYKSSNDMALDQAALRAARESTYSPKIVNCRPTQGTYLFRAILQPK